MLKKDLKKAPRTKIILLWGFFLILALGVLIPLLLPDSGRTNLEKNAGRAAVEHIQQYSHGIDGTLGTLRLLVERIEPDNPTYVNSETLCNNTFHDTSDPQAASRYAVTVASKTLFGITLHTDIVHVCRIK